jgi:hypothetical protein
VVSKYPLGEVIQNSEAEGRIAKWALELMGQNITYAPRSAIKSQVLADFIVEWTEIQTPPSPIEHETWIMYFDGSVMKEGVGVGLAFIPPLGVRMEYLVRLHFPASNNAAEYEALINSLRIAVELGIKRFEIGGDSELLVDQVMKDKELRGPKDGGVLSSYCSGATMVQCPPSDFYDFFKKNLDNYVETDCTSERLFGQKLDLARRAMACVGRDVAARSKLLVPTPPRLWCEDLRAQLESSSLRPTSF